MVEISRPEKWRRKYSILVLSSSSDRLCSFSRIHLMQHSSNVLVGSSPILSTRHASAFSLSCSSCACFLSPVPRDRLILFPVDDVHGQCSRNCRLIRLKVNASNKKGALSSWVMSAFMRHHFRLRQGHQKGSSNETNQAVCNLRFLHPTRQEMGFHIPK